MPYRKKRKTPYKRKTYRKKKTTKRAVTKKTPKTRKSATKAKGTLRKRFKALPKPRTPRVRGSMSAPKKRNPSKRAADTPQAQSDSVVKDIKKYMKLDEDPQKANKEVMKQRASKWRKAKKWAADVGKKQIEGIETTARFIDKGGAWAEKAAPYVTAAAAANPELAPILDPIAAGIDLYGAGHNLLHTMIDETEKAYKKGDANRLGIGQYTQSKKYQKLMADIGDEDQAMVPYTPNELSSAPTVAAEDPEFYML